MEPDTTGESTTPGSEPVLSDNPPIRMPIKAGAPRPGLHQDPPIRMPIKAGEPVPSEEEEVLESVPDGEEAGDRTATDAEGEISIRMPIKAGEPVPDTEPAPDVKEEDPA